jgi:hypothetical protein
VPSHCRDLGSISQALHLCHLGLDLTKGGHNTDI